MSTLSEKRVYAAADEPTPLYVAAEQGVVRAMVSGDAVGEFSLARRCTARDVSLGGDGLLAVATADTTLVGGGTDGLLETGFGPAVAVSFHDRQGEAGALVAADAEGTVARLQLGVLDEGSPTAEDWVAVGTVDDARALDAPLIAAADGVHRVLGGALDSAGLDDARDVTSRGAPLAATGGGLYELGNGWMEARDGAHDTVATDGERAHAVDTAGTLWRRTGREWREAEFPAGERPVDIAYTADAVVVVSASGSVHVNAGDGWRSRALGVTGVQAVAAPRRA
jgi:hypothetical protein